MAFNIPSLNQLTDFVIGVARALLPTKNWSRYAPGWKFFRSIVVAVTEVHAHVTTALKDLMPDTASGEFLDRWGFVVNITRKSATPARKSSALRITGTLSATVSAGDTLVHDATGLRFMVNEDETIPAALFVDVDIVAIDTGKQTQLSEGETLRFETPPTNINEEATLVLDLDEDGDDAESDAAYRERILDRFSNPPLGGAQNDYVQWALQVTGIASAYAYPGRAGRNSVDVAALHSGTGTARLLTGGEIAELLAYLDEKKPAGVAIRVLTVDDQEQNIIVRVKPNGESQYEFDWDDSTSLTVSTWNGTTRQLTFTTDRPTSMKAGDRISIAPNTAGGDGIQHVIESLVSTNAVILETVPALAPTGSSAVYSGGPLVDPIRDAIIEHVASLGTSNTDLNPYGSWEANLRPENLTKICQSIVGVKKSSVLQPSSTVEPPDNEYPNDGTVYIIVPVLVQVRRDWT